MPGKDGHVRSMISVTEDLEPGQDHMPECKCSDNALNFLGSEWGPAPTCMLNLSQAIYKPEVFKMLQARLPQAAQAVASAPAGAPLSAISRTAHLGVHHMNVPQEDCLSVRLQDFCSGVNLLNQGTSGIQILT